MNSHESELEELRIPVAVGLLFNVLILLFVHLTAFLSSGDVSSRKVWRRIWVTFACISLTLWNLSNMIAAASGRLSVTALM